MTETGLRIRKRWIVSLSLCRGWGWRNTQGLVGVAWLFRGTGLGPEHCVEVSAGVGIVGLESQRLLELANRLLVAAFAAEGDAEVIVCIRVSRFQMKGFLVLADRLVNLAFPHECVGEVVVGVGFIQIGRAHV